MDARLQMDFQPFAKAGSCGTEDRLVRLHASLVRRIAWHVNRRVSSALDAEELTQIGMIALIEAARTFEDRGAAFTTYATVRVRGAMVDALRRHSSVNRGVVRRQRDLSAARREMGTELGRAPTGVELGHRLGLAPRVIAMLESASAAPRMEPIDSVYSEESDQFADDAPDALSALLGRSLRADVVEAIKRLPEREAMVLQLYFVEEFGLEQIGDVMGIGAARVCQIKKRALERVRSMLSGWA